VGGGKKIALIEETCIRFRLMSTEERPGPGAEKGGAGQWLKCGAGERGRGGGPWVLGLLDCLPTINVRH